MDYAKDLASWGYEDLQRQVSLATGRSGNAVYELVRERSPDLDEADFVDNVTRYLRRGEFLLLIVGDGIREDAAHIVDFVQSHSGLHFNLALVEAALYRDTEDRLIVQPRVLARTEIVQRFVVEGGVAADDGPAEEEEPQGRLRREENRRFWRAVVREFAFADPEVGVPEAGDDATLPVLVPNSGFGGWGLCFSGYLARSGRQFGCYLTVRKDQERDVRIFDQLLGSLCELRADAGDELDQWRNSAGRPRVGFRQEQLSLAFLAQDEESEAFREAVAWMRVHLDLLVSNLHPRLQRMLADER